MTRCRRLLLSTLVVCLAVPIAGDALHAEGESVRDALSALRPPVATGRFRPTLTALQDIEVRLREERIASLRRVLPKAPAGWKFDEDNWQCRQGLSGTRRWEGSGERRLELRIEENSQDKDILDVTIKLLDPERVRDPYQTVMGIGGRQVLLTVTEDEGDGDARVEVQWVLPRPDRARMHGGLSLVSLTADWTPRQELIALASTVDVAAIQAQLGDAPSADDPEKLAPALLLVRASRAYADGALAGALTHTRALAKRTAADRARHLASVLPTEPAGWRYVSGGLGGWPASVSKRFTNGPDVSVIVGISEKPDAVRAVSAKLNGSDALAANERLSRLGGRKAVLLHNAKDAMWLLRVPTTDGTGVVSVRSWGATDATATELFAGLVDLARLERALAR